jgi:hypothetical protein
VAERELSPSQKAAIYIELGMLEEDKKAKGGQGARNDLTSTGSSGSSEEAVVRAAHKAGVGRDTMRDAAWLSKNAPTGG